VNRTVALAALNYLLGGEVDLFPVDLIAHDASSHDFFDRLTAHAADHIARVTAGCQSRRFSWWGDPLLAALLHAHFSSEAFALLHTLHKGLDASSELLCELVAGNIICWVSSECTTSIVFGLLRLNVYNLLTRTISLHESLLATGRQRVMRFTEETCAVEDRAMRHIRGRLVACERRRTSHSHDRVGHVRAALNAGSLRAKLARSQLVKSARLIQYVFVTTFSLLHRSVSTQFIER